MVESSLCFFLVDFWTLERMHIMNVRDFVCLSQNEKSGGEAVLMNTLQALAKGIFEHAVLLFRRGVGVSPQYVKELYSDGE